MRTWNIDDPKAALMARKQDALIEAAQRAFLADGYAESSVNRIASEAGVSIKTLYRHFENKADLFLAVIQAACASFREAVQGNQVDGEIFEPTWFALPPAEALPQAASTYLKHVLSADQIGLFRIVARDSVKFPEIGALYRENVVDERDQVIVAYIKRWEKQLNWQVGDSAKAASAFVALVHGGLFEKALLGLDTPNNEEIKLRANEVTKQFLVLLNDDCF